MELISTTKTYRHYWQVKYNDEVIKEYNTIITHYDGSDMNTIRIVTKDLHGNYIEDEAIEKYVQDKYIEYCIINDIPHE